MNATTQGATAPIVFQFQQFPINVILKEGEPWFIANEVCAALGMTVEATRRLDADEKGLTKVQTPGGEQEVTIISEPGLYRLIGRSNKPAAKAFNRWACHDVFPAIRKTGRYEAQPVLDAPAPPQLNSESEDEQRTKLALAALHGGKFMTYFGDNGVTVMMPVKRTAFVVEPEEIAGILKEPGNVPLRLLPEIIMACATRLSNASPSAPKPTGVAV